jgi:hypothetical protein
MLKRFSGESGLDKNLSFPTLSGNPGKIIHT